MKRCVVVLLMVVLGFAPTHGQAVAADEITPANEAICDELMGGTPGLYGLCVAFCEAQDCEATFYRAGGEVTFRPNCKPSNPKLLVNYNRLRNSDDPEMPCINVVDNECPCWTQDELTAIADGGLNRCGETVDGYALSAYGPRRLRAGAAISFDESEELNGGECYYRVMTPQYVVRNLQVTFTEAENCALSIQAECANRGL